MKLKSAIKFHAKKTTIKAFKSLKSLAHKNRINPLELRKLEAIADRYSENRIRGKYFDNWISYFNTHAVPIQLQIDEIVKRRNRLLL